jgi:hypothetical protein
VTETFAFGQMYKIYYGAGTKSPDTMGGDALEGKEYVGKGRLLKQCRRKGRRRGVEIVIGSGRAGGRARLRYLAQPQVMNRRKPFPPCLWP